MRTLLSQVVPEGGIEADQLSVDIRLFRDVATLEQQLALLRRQAAQHILHVLIGVADHGLARNVKRAVVELREAHAEVIIWLQGPRCDGVSACA
jgi:hypothetical protein